MIRAKFIKAVPTEEGITYTLKGESDKTALHSAVDLQGEECFIGIAQDTPQDNMPAFLMVMRDMILREIALAKEQGYNEAKQGNLLTGEGETK